MIAGSIIMSRALSPVEQAVGQWRGFITARQGFKRLREIVDKQPPEPERMELPLPSQSLEVDGLVSGPVGKPVLKNLAFTLKAETGWA